MQDGIRARLSGRELVAVYFAAAILLVIVVIVIVLLVGWRSPLPTLDSLPPEAQATSIQRYKEMTQVLSERTEKIFDLFVTKSLLPLFATLIGYLLGRRTSE